jgi:hypothetical protein
MRSKIGVNGVDDIIVNFIIFQKPEADYNGI